MTDKNTYTPKVIREQGGDVQRVKSGGSVVVDDGGEVDVSAAQGLLTLPNVANVATSGGIPELFRIDIAGGAAGDTDVTLDYKVRVIDAWAVHTAAGDTSDTLQVKNGANAITDAMDWSGADKAVVRAGEIDDANHEIAASGTLRVTTVDGDGGDDVGAGTVYVLAIRVA